MRNDGNLKVRAQCFEGLATCTYIYRRRVHNRILFNSNLPVYKFAHKACVRAFARIKKRARRERERQLRPSEEQRSGITNSVHRTRRKQTALLTTLACVQNLRRSAAALQRMETGANGNGNQHSAALVSVTSVASDQPTRRAGSVPASTTLAASYFVK